MSDSLLDLTVQVRELSGRPLDDAGLDRMRKKISRMTAGEATEARTTLKHLLGHAPAKVNRDRP